MSSNVAVTLVCAVVVQQYQPSTAVLQHMGNAFMLRFTLHVLFLLMLDDLRRGLQQAKLEGWALNLCKEHSHNVCVCKQM
jgi:hypothetical protein